MEITTEPIDDIICPDERPAYIYISGPMTKPGFELSQKISKEVARIEGKLVAAGFAVFSPWGSVNHIENWDGTCEADHSDWIEADCEWLFAMYAMREFGLAESASILMLSFDSDGKIDYHCMYPWQDSKGARTEYEYAANRNFDLYEWAEDGLLEMNGGDA